MGEFRMQARRLASAEVVSAAPARRVLLAALFALLTALGAHLSVPLPGPVPLSMQTLFVVLSGLLLGARLGAAAQATYLAAGILGLPVFAHGFGGPGVLLGATGGYLLAFPAAAALAGWCAERGERRRGAVAFMLLLAGAVAGSAAILAGGWAQLTLLTGSASRAAAVGVLPFLLGDLFKVALALLLAVGLRSRVRELV